MKKYILLLLSLCLMILSCQDEAVPLITLSKSEITVSDAGGSQDISFESNVSWTAKSSESWCTIYPASGDASTKSFSLTSPVNYTYSDRSCIVTIKAGGLSKTLTVNQSANLGLILTQDKYDLTNDATTIEVGLKANVEFEVFISDKWITSVATRALTTSKLSFDIAKNESYDGRAGSITIKQKNGTLTSTIDIYQSHENAIILSRKTVELSGDSHNLKVELKTNVDVYEVIIPEVAKSWISYVPTRALRTETLLLLIAANEGEESRTSEVYIKNVANAIQDTLTITQNNKDIDNNGIIKYVSEIPSGRKNGDSETDAADYLNDNFWTQVNNDLKSKDVEVKFLPGNYLRINDQVGVNGLLLKGIGNEKNKLTISGGEDVIFQVPEGVKTKSNLIYLNGCQNILIKDLHFTGNGSIHYVLGIRSNIGLPASKNIVIENCSWIDMRGIVYGATGCHFERTTNITYKNCTFKRIGVGAGSHMMYHAYGSTNISVIDCHFEDCMGDYVRFRDRCDYGLVKNSVFVRSNNDFPGVSYLAVPCYNDVDPGDEYFATNYSFTDNYFINNGTSNSGNAISFRQRGYSPKEYKYLLTSAEGNILLKGANSDQIKLLQSNFGIDVMKIRITDNTYSVRFDNHVILYTKNDYGAASLGWNGSAPITHLMNNSKVPFDWE